jgi:hypothetical protein
MSRHQVRPAPVRTSPLVAIALSLLLASLLVFAAGPVAPVGEAAKGASISITADQQTVKSGDNDTLHIRLQNVQNATLNGEALKGDKIDRKVLVCATTTYTVEGIPQDGGPKISQSLTIYATGTTTKAACPSPTATPNPLPDLVVVSLTPSQRALSGPQQLEYVQVDYVVKNIGKEPAGPFVTRAYVGSQRMEGDLKLSSLGPGESAKGMGHWEIPRSANQTFTLKVVTDEDNQVAEADETNNTQTGSVTIGAPKGLSGIFQRLDKADQLPDIFKIKP